MRNRKPISMPAKALTSDSQRPNQGEFVVVEAETMDVIDISALYQRVSIVGRGDDKYFVVSFPGLLLRVERDEHCQC